MSRALHLPPQVPFLLGVLITCFQMEIVNLDVLGIFETT